MSEQENEIFDNLVNEFNEDIRSRTEVLAKVLKDRGYKGGISINLSEVVDVVQNIDKKSSSIKRELDFKFKEWKSLITN